MTATGYEGRTDCNQRCVQSLKKKREVMKEERKQERWCLLEEGNGCEALKKSEKAEHVANGCSDTWRTLWCASFLDLRIQ